jgi:hypothetical protein
MSGYVLHPEAYNDLDGIWEFIAEDDWMLRTGCAKKSTKQSASSCLFPTRVIGAPI